MTTAYQFDESSHIYIVGSREIPGCTRVLDHSGMVNYRFVRPDIMERKSQLGKEVHRCSKLLDEKILDWTTTDDAVIPYLEAWVDFKRQMKFVPKLREYQCVAEANGMLFGMQIDAQGVISKWDAIVEIKICTTIMPHHKVQTAGYALGLPKAKISSALARFATRKRFIAQLKPDGRCNVIECADRDDAQAFISALWLSTWKRRHEQIYREAV